VLRPNPKDITETFAQPFRRYMKAAGWEEGRNIRFLFVWAEGRSERIRQILDDSRGKITGIVTSSSRLITQIRKAGGSCRRL